MKKDKLKSRANLWLILGIGLSIKGIAGVIWGLTIQNKWLVSFSMLPGIVCFIIAGDYFDRVRRMK